MMDDAQIQRELTAEKMEEITRHSSTFVNDAKVIFDFIEELSRNDEMTRAVRGQGAFPGGNWIHSFSTFQDIVEVLRTTFNVTTRLSRVALEANLKRELSTNLVELTYKTHGKIIPHFQYATGARKQFSGGVNSSSQISGKNLFGLLLYVVPGVRAERLSAQFVEQALNQGEFLEFDFEHGTYSDGLISNALFELKRNLALLKTQVETYQGKQFEFVEKYKEAAHEGIEASVTNWDLLMPLAISRVEENVVNLSFGLYKALNGDTKPLSKLKLNHPSPLPSFAQESKAETASFDEILKWFEAQ
jgi:hypothetical protein